METLLKLERTVVEWLTQDYQQRSLRTAVTKAYARFAQRHPQWVAALFDEHFIRHHLLPMLQEAAAEGRSVTPYQVAQRFARQISIIPSSRAKYSAAIMPAATQFLLMVADGLTDAPVKIVHTTTLDVPAVG